MQNVPNGYLLPAQSAACGRCKQKLKYLTMVYQGASSLAYSSSLVDALKPLNSGINIPPISCHLNMCKTGMPIHTCTSEFLCFWYIELVAEMNFVLVPLAVLSGSHDFYGYPMWVLATKVQALHMRYECSAGTVRRFPPRSNQRKRAMVGMMD